MKCRPFYLKQVKWSTTNDECPKTGQIGRQKMRGFLGQVKLVGVLKQVDQSYGSSKIGQIGRQKIIGVIRQVKLMDKK